VKRFSVAVLLLALTGCDAVRARRARSRVPHVVLVSIDTLHVDHIGPYNTEVTTTPFLDAFARDGVRFEYAYTHTPITLPSHASLMTGVSPPSLGVMANGDQLPGEATTLAEIFSDAGYRTAAFISLGVLQETYGLHQGFQIFHDPFVDGPMRWYRRAHEIIGPIKTWIDGHNDEPFFLWTHFSDPHEPYLLPDGPADTELLLDGTPIGEYMIAGADHRRAEIELTPGEHELTFRSLWEVRADDRPETGVDVTMLIVEGLPGADDVVLPAPLRPTWSVSLRNDDAESRRVSIVFAGRLQRPPPSFVMPNYDENVSRVDHYLEELQGALEDAGIADETLVVIVSDHGEGLFAHNVLGHAAFVYEDQLRIVWMMKGASLPPGTVIEDRPGLMTDIAPTLLDIVGLSSAGMEGRSWRSCLTGAECPENEPWWSYGLNHETRGLTAMAGYRWPYKWIWRRSFRRIAFDASQDPREEHNLLKDPGPHNPEPLKRAAESFRNERRRLSRVLKASRPDAPSDERERLLRSLGYLGGGGAAPSEPDEKDEKDDDEGEREP